EVRMEGESEQPLFALDGRRAVANVEKGVSLRVRRDRIHLTGAFEDESPIAARFGSEVDRLLEAAGDGVEADRRAARDGRGLLWLGRRARVAARDERDGRGTRESQKSTAWNGAVGRVGCVVHRCCRRMRTSGWLKSCRQTAGCHRLR